MNTPTIIKKSAQTETRWAGGTTTELFIFPDDAEYKKLNFDLRLSTASIEVEESHFTPLPDVRRTLMVLEGNLRLEHKGHHSIGLRPFDADNFSGEWDTCSSGRVVNFNIMMRNSTRCKHKVLRRTANDYFKIASIEDFTCYYLYSGAAKTSEGIINPGDLLVVPQNRPYSFNTITDSILIEVCVRLV